MITTKLFETPAVQEEKWAWRHRYLALSNLKGDLAGKYYALGDMIDAEQQQLIDDHFLFDKPVSTCIMYAKLDGWSGWMDGTYWCPGSLRTGRCNDEMGSGG